MENRELENQKFLFLVVTLELLERETSGSQVPYFP
jgi:hypothetical protein